MRANKRKAGSGKPKRKPSPDAPSPAKLAEAEARAKKADTEAVKAARKAKTAKDHLAELQHAHYQATRPPTLSESVAAEVYYNGLAVACEVCKAAAGKDCTRRNGEVGPMHITRMQAGQAASEVNGNG